MPEWRKKRGPPPIKAAGYSDAPSRTQGAWSYSPAAGAGGMALALTIAAGRSAGGVFAS